MKVLHVPFHFYPDAVGGTEVYALSLARSLAKAGTAGAIAAPGSERSAYEYEGLSVYRFAPGPAVDVSNIYGRGDDQAAEQFRAILDEYTPDLVHLHGISPAISLKVLRIIRGRGIPSVLTVHIPGILCPRGTFMRFGTRVCDGVLKAHKCAACSLNAHGMTPALARLVGHVPVGVGAVLAGTGHQAGWLTALRMSQLLGMREEMLRDFFAEVDHVVAVSEWIRQSLLVNGVRPEKLTLSRHGATQSNLEGYAAPPVTTAQGPKRIAFVGRLNDSKGVHVLVDAVLRSPRLSITLDIFGIVQDETGYVAELRRKCSADKRIQFLDPLRNDDVPRALSRYDALAVPSLWMETGPLVVYDAFLAGIPVIGSRRGGIAELVSHERNGLLVDPCDSPAAWAETLLRFCEEPGLAGELRAGVPAPRGMAAVAVEMAELYQRLSSSCQDIPSGRLAEPAGARV